MTKSEDYRRALRSLDDWDGYLLEESGLPGPRANLELAQAVADEGDHQLFERYLTYTAEKATVNSPYEFLAFCGAIGLGRLLAEGDSSQLETLRLLASDPRWRMREAAATALQRLGDVDMDQLLAAMFEWSQGTPFEQRAAAAALCEPRLLVRPEHASAVLQVLDRITAALERAESRRSAGFQALRKALGYCWSVAVAASPDEGKGLMEHWMGSADPDVRWIMRENLKKARLARLDPGWVRAWQARAVEE
ncbi:MAG TPA: HEAT repeat domain-containing protein [Anaerolineales bacterium]|nr:HEAT repeat domain-containing protein [Anaerolineales bacterium]